jgi:uncharacterized Zn finger protein
MTVHLRSRRGAIGTTWQGRAMREIVERGLAKDRAASGRRLARGDRVEWLDVTIGVARAAVTEGTASKAEGSLAAARRRAADPEGASADPEDKDAEGNKHFHPRLDIRPLTDDDREITLEVLRAHPELATRLAAGEYPPGIERQLTYREVSLFPRGVSEIFHDCTCQDWPGPCKHVAALGYVLAEAIDEHPAHLLTLRGITIADIAPRPLGPGEGIRALTDEMDADDVDRDDAVDAADATDGADGGSSTDGTGGTGAGGAGAGGGDRNGSPDVDGAPGSSPDGADAPVFDPTLANEAILHNTLGHHVADLLTSFYDQVTDTARDREESDGEDPESGIR